MPERAFAMASKPCLMFRISNIYLKGVAQYLGRTEFANVTGFVRGIKVDDSSSMWWDLNEEGGG